jgi:hypothetical protein
MTPSQSVGKKFNGNSLKGLKVYYLDVPRLESINFNTPHTMMKWWLKNGYDPDTSTWSRVKATQQMTETLKSKFDAVYHKGGGWKTLDIGPQIVVFDPSHIYRVDNALAKPGEIGCTVIRKSTGEKGTLLGVREIMETNDAGEDVRQKYHGGNERFLTVKWSRSGMDYSVYDSDVTFAQPKTAAGERWQGGYCTVFANALHQKFGWPIWAIVEESGEQKTVVHAFCRKGELAIDSKGPHDFNALVKAETARRQYPGKPETKISVYEVTPEQLQAMSTQDLNDTALAVQFIDQNAGLFQKTADRKAPEPADWEDWRYASGDRWISQFYIKAPETQKGYIPYTAVMQSWTDAEPGLPTFGNRAVSFLFLNADANLLGAYGTTNTGHVAEVFTKVGGLVMSALRNLRPPAMYFSAEGAGRAALYARMARLGAAASGYIPYVVDQGAVTYFALVSPTVDADYRYWGKDVIQPLMTAKTAKTASEWGGFCPRCGSDQTAWAMHSPTTDTYFCLDCKGSTDIERDMHPSLRAAMKIAGLVGYPWAIWEGKALLSPRGMAHTDWFARMGIPDRGPEFDRIPRGNFYIDNDKEQIYVWTDAEDYDYSKNPEESLDDTVVFGPWGGRRFDLKFTPPEVIEAIKRKYPHSETYEVVDWMPPGSVHKWSSGEWWRRWRKTYLIPKGTILYHGTAEDFPAMDIQTPAWFSTSRSVAENFQGWHGGEEGNFRILEYQVTKPIRLPRIDGGDDLERLEDMFGLRSQYGTEEILDSLPESGLPGWIIPHNYPDGDDILLADDYSITPINEPEEEEVVSQEGLPPGAWREADLPGYWTREGTTTIYHMTPEEIAEREQRLQKRSAKEPVEVEEATWSRPLYHGTSAYRAKKIKTQKSFYGETEGYNEMGVGVYTHPSMNRTSPWAAGRAQGAFMELHFTRPLKLAVKNPQGEWVSSMGGESHRFISKAPTQRELIDAGYDGIYDKHGTTQVPHQVLLFNQPVLGAGGAHKLNQLIDWDKVRIINFNESQHGYLKGLENTEEAPYYRGASKTAGKFVWPPYEEWIDGFHPYLENEAAEQGEENLAESEELRDIYDGFVQTFSSWRFPITIWRAVKLGSIEDLDTTKLGVAWTFRENMAVPYAGMGGEEFILRAKVPASSIDWDMTMELNLYGGEDEVRLIEGAPVMLEGYTIKDKWSGAKDQWFPLKKRLTAADDRPMPKEFVTTKNLKTQKPYQPALVNTENRKMMKGIPKGYLTGVMHLMPADKSGYGNVCPFSTPECRHHCLNTAGEWVNSPKIQGSRIYKTKLYFTDRPTFLKELRKSIEKIVRKAKKMDLLPAIRINGTSDLPNLGVMMAKEYPMVQFYDYTKVPKPWEKIRENYDIVFSRSETNEKEVQEALKHGVSVAVVFDLKPKQPLPAQYYGRPVIDGDLHDLRFLDKLEGEPPFVVGLRAKGKGRGKGTETGFVLKVEPLPEVKKASARELPHIEWFEDEMFSGPPREE